MNAQNTAKLKEDFPEMFGWRLLDDAGRATHFPGFECGDGWFKLIHDLCAKLRKPAYRRHYYGWNGPVLQVKEKFGELRFYMGNGPYQIHPIIEAATNKSITICEECGKGGKIINWNGWYKTLCVKCHEARAVPKLSPKRASRKASKEPHGLLVPTVRS